MPQAKNRSRSGGGRKAAKNVANRKVEAGWVAKASARLADEDEDVGRSPGHG